MSFVIGVDIGGTNTDVAIVQGSNVIGWNKSLTTNHIIDGVINSIQLAVVDAEQNGHSNVIGSIRRVNIGTTQFINAVINRQGLEKVACLRLCGITSHDLPPFCDFPRDLQEQVDGGAYLVNGGFDYDSKVITELNDTEVYENMRKIEENGIRHVAISGIFSPTNPTQEEHVGNIIEEHFPTFSCTLSSKLGRLGLLERENAAIINESLKTLCNTTITGFNDALEGIGLTCSMYFTQNDGTLISEKETLHFPVHTFASGATNSMRGAAYLSHLKDAVIVDIGGTSTDVGVLVNSFPRESSTRVKIGGVHINFRMPDTTSIGLGGGSIVTQQENKVSVGPCSVGYKIVEEALIFGGTTLVASDVAVACGLAKFGNVEKVANLSTQLLDTAIKNIKTQVEMAVDSVKLSGERCPVILVGGGSVLIDPTQQLHGASVVRRPKYYQVANAVGAAISQVSGTFDELCHISESTRVETINKAKVSAIDRAVENGAIRETCQIVEISEVQMAYMVIPYARLCIKAVGELENYTKRENILEEKVDKERLLSNPTVTTDIKRHQQGIKDDVSPLNTTMPTNYHQFPSHTPEVNDKGEWVLNEWDVDCLAIGAGILGCGGGGSTYLGRLKLMRCLKKGKRPRIIHPSSMSETTSAFPLAIIGAPEVSTERLDGTNILKSSMKINNQLLSLGFQGGLASDDVIKVATQHNLSIEHTENGTLWVCISETSQSIHSAVIMPVEIGGQNALEPLIVAAELDVPVVDCDGMGRAFPQVQHYTPFIYDSSPYPAVISDSHGNSVCYVKCNSATALEEEMRKECVKMGCIAGVCVKPLSREEVLTKTCLFTLSHAWKIGNAVKTARQHHHSAITSILQSAGGIVICQGKICDLQRESRGGFTWGQITIEGDGAYADKIVNIDFQNEFIIARLSSSSEVLATVPDLITVVDSGTGEPISTSELRYGLRIGVLLLPAMPRLTTPKALQFVGPAAFKLENVEYKRVCEFTGITSILPSTK